MVGIVCESRINALLYPFGSNQTIRPPISYNLSRDYSPRREVVRRGLTEGMRGGFTEGMRRGLTEGMRGGLIEVMRRGSLRG